MGLEARAQSHEAKSKVETEAAIFGLEAEARHRGLTSLFVCHEVINAN